MNHERNRTKVGCGRYVGVRRACVFGRRCNGLLHGVQLQVLRMVKSSSEFGSLVWKHFLPRSAHEQSGFLCAYCFYTVVRKEEGSQRRTRLHLRVQGICVFRRSMHLFRSDQHGTSYRRRANRSSAAVSFGAGFLSDIVYQWMPKGTAELWATG